MSVLGSHLPLGKCPFSSWRSGDALPDRGEIPEALQAVLAPWGRYHCQARALCLLRAKENDLLHPAEIEQHPEKSH